MRSDSDSDGVGDSDAYPSAVSEASFMSSAGNEHDADIERRRRLSHESVQSISSSLGDTRNRGMILTANDGNDVRSSAHQDDIAMPRTCVTTALQSMPALPSYVSVILHLEIRDVPALGIDLTAKASVSWKCVESSEMGLLPTFVLQMSTGLEAEYFPSRGVVSGTTSDGAPFKHEFGSPQDDVNGRRSKWLQHERVGANQTNTARRVDETLRVLIRLCQCLAMRSMQLRKQALLLDTNKLPMVHYDTLPDTLLNSFRRANLEAALRQTRAAVERQDHHQPNASDSGDCNKQQQSVEISGVGRGYLDPLSGDLRVVFLDGSELTLASDGTRLHFQLPGSSHADEFQLLTTRSASGAFLPTVVRKSLESVPDFIRKLRSAW